LGDKEEIYRSCTTTENGDGDERNVERKTMKMRMKPIPETKKRREEKRRYKSRK
jgi:hypothetical protein